MSIQRTKLLPRKEFVRDARIFVIAVEGEKTEAQYFSLFESTRVHIEILSTGSDGLSAPKHVLERLVKFEEQYDLGPDDERWLVADVDRQRGQFLKEVARDAQKSGYSLAFSNPCFELWLLLHFQDADPTDTACRAVVERLRLHTDGHNKAKLKIDLYAPDKIEAAIVRAKALAGAQNTRWPDCPGTHVFKVAEKLLRSRRSET